MENKNLLVALVICVSFLFLWSTFIVPRFSPPAPIQTTVPADKQPAETAAALSEKPAEVVAGRKVAEEAPRPEAILRDEHNEIFFTSKGGAIRAWNLKVKGQEIHLVEHADKEPMPLSTFPDASFSFKQTPGQQVMTTTLDKGVRVTKTLSLSSSGFLHDFTLKFDNPGTQTVELKNWDWGWGPGLGTVATEKKENSGMTRALTLTRAKGRALKPGDQPECGRWCGVDNRYFLFAIIPPSDHQPAISVTGTKEHTQLTVKEQVSIPPRASTTIHYQIYMGPKGYTSLKQYGKGLEEGVDFGFFSPLGKLILRAVYWLQNRTGNYGWAIVIMTIILQLLMMPLTLKSFKATLAMKKLQPRIAEMQKQFKGDPKRLNIEMMNLYKNSGTNPFGGCLPMLMQLPIFWALFTTLRNAYELRGEPWVLWIHDLSAADPLYILPVVMGGAMYFQQKLSGAVTDPTQRQMMIMMPVIFTVMFINFPSGLVLYWLTSNLVNMALQWSFTRYQQNRVEIIPPR